MIPRTAAVSASAPEHGWWSQFMLGEVWPQMADLLKIPHFDPMKQPDGFSCSTCHMVEGQ